MGIRALLGLHPMVGSIIIKFDCRGCMASDHRFEWVGIGKCAWREKIAGSNDTYTHVEVRKLKTTTGQGDVRDGEQGRETIIAEDGAVQRIIPGLYFIFK